MILSLSNLKFLFSASKSYKLAVYFTLNNVNLDPFRSYDYIQYFNHVLGITSAACNYYKSTHTE